MVLGQIFVWWIAAFILLFVFFDAGFLPAIIIGFIISLLLQAIFGEVPDRTQGDV